MQYIGYIIDIFFRNHIYKIRVIHWISYQPYEQPGLGTVSQRIVRVLVDVKHV